MSEQFLKTYLKKLKLSSLERKIPNISEENAEFIKNLIREKQPEHILEIGTANGYSTLQFASVLGEWSDITTIEYAANAHAEAIEHFSKCKTKNVHAISGDAKKMIPSLADDHFDFLFIDAMKREYLDYLLFSLPKLKKDALIVIDDVEKFRNKMENLYVFLDENTIPYSIKKTDTDDSIMIIKASLRIKNLHKKMKNV
jgi:predicted O-methyltransferase YrrM